MQAPTLQTLTHLERIKANIRNCSYEEAVANCNLASTEIKVIGKLGEGKTAMMNEKNAGRIVSWYEMIEVESLKSYCFVNMNRIQEAIQILEQCLEYRPNHSLSHRRLGYAYEKEGNVEAALKEYKLAELYEPENHTLTKTIMKLEKIITKTTITSANDIDGEIKQYSSPSVESNSSNPKQHVTFGTSQVFEMMSENSDEYFAHIKNELTKLNDVKPKKSILKGSKSLNKDSTSLASHHSSTEHKIEMLEEPTIKKTLSMKSWNAESPMKWDQADDLQMEKKEDKEKLGSAKKEKKKKKGVSFSVAKDGAQEKQ